MATGHSTHAEIEDKGTNPLMIDGPLDVAGNLVDLLRFLSAAVLAHGVCHPQAREGLARTVDMATEAAEFLKSRLEVQP